MIENARKEVSTDSVSRLAYLRTLPEGSPVTYRPGRTGHKKSRGIFIGFDTINDEQYILIQVPGGEINKMPAWMADRVEPLSNSRMKPSRHLRFTRVNQNAGLLAGVLTLDQVSRFIGGSRLNCVVIGNRNSLEREVLDVSFAVSAGGNDRIDGRLQDALRVRRLAREGDCYRSDVISVASRSVPARLASPPVVIFDGSRSFLRWRSSYPNAHWIAVLDRVDRRLKDAVQVVDSLYATRVAHQAPLKIKSVPVGIECVAFERK